MAWFGEAGLGATDVVLTALTEVFSEYEIAGVAFAGRETGELLSDAVIWDGDASKGGTLATGFWTLAVAGGVTVVGLAGSSTGWTGAACGGATGAAAEVLFEKRLAQDLPGAGCGCGCTTGGGKSPRFLGVGGGGKSEAVGAGGGGCGTGGGSGTAVDFLECPNGDLFVTIKGGPCECSVIEIGIGALLGGRGGSRFECSAGTGVLVLSEFSLVGERFATLSLFCLFPKGAFGVEADC